MIVRALAVGPLQANAYLLTEGEHTVLVDPGDEAPRLLAAVREAGGRLEAVWLTHAHFDHVGALADVLDAWEVPVHLHPGDLPLLRQAAASAAQWGVTVRQPPADTRALAHGQVLTLGGTTVRCLHTPGHAPGHVAFHLPSEGAVLSGDALFRGSVGRTDLPFGDAGALLAGIREHLLSLSDETRVLPGHGPATTIGLERRSNPFLQPARR